MKKLCSILLVCFMLVALAAPCLAAEQYTGVSTEAELMSMLESIESDIMGWGNETGCWKLTADITVTTKWPTVSYFDGFFDGNGHTITFKSGVVMGDALFDFLDENATIANLNISGLTVKSSFGSVGALVNDNHGLIYGVSLSEISVSSDLSYVAGLANSNSGKIAMCKLDDITVTSGADEVGGVCYENKGLISDVHVTNANITGKTNAAAGIASKNDAKGTIEFCTVSGHVKSQFHVGGIVGRGKGMIRNCINYATIEATTGRVGGIIGSAQDKLTISGCGNYGDIVAVASNGGNVGGIANLTKENKDVTLENCFNAGNVIVKSNKAVQVGSVMGNFVGGATVDNCYSIKGTIFIATAYSGTTDGMNQYTDSNEDDSTNGTEVAADLMNSEKMIQKLGLSTFVAGTDGYAIKLGENPDAVAAPEMPEVEEPATEATEPETTATEETQPSTSASEQTPSTTAPAQTPAATESNQGTVSESASGWVYVAIAVVAVLLVGVAVFLVVRKRAKKDK